LEVVVVDRVGVLEIGKLWVGACRQGRAQQDEKRQARSNSWHARTSFALQMRPMSDPAAGFHILEGW
jgi:hypothetical protein